MKATITTDTEITQEDGKVIHYIEWSDHTEEKPHCSTTIVYVPD